MRVLEFSGDPREMGSDFGAACREDIHELYRRRADNALAQARLCGRPEADEGDLLSLARASLEITRAHHADGYAELEGIAHGSGLSIEQVLAMNGLTDLRDALAWGGPLEAAGGCSACIAQRDATREGRVLFAQTWDLASDNLPFVVGVVRRPRSGPATWSLTTTGCLSLIGINESGLVVGTTNLRTRDARAGVVYLSAIHRALACDRFDDALASIAGAQRAGGHSFILADAAGRASILECSAQHALRRNVDRGTAVQCNHCLAPKTAALEGEAPRASSLSRHKRLEALLAGWAGEIDEDALESFLADEANGENAICRDDFEGISTNAAAIIAPETGAMRVCHGLPSRGTWQWLREPEKRDCDG